MSRYSRVHIIGCLLFSVLYLTSTCLIFPFLCLPKWNSFYPVAFFIVMEFDFAQINITLKIDVQIILSKSIYWCLVLNKFMKKCLIIQYKHSFQYNIHKYFMSICSYSGNLLSLSFHICPSFLSFLPRLSVPVLPSYHVTLPIPAVIS